MSFIAGNCREAKAAGKEDEVVKLSEHWWWMKNALECSLKGSNSNITGVLINSPEPGLRGVFISNLHDGKSMLLAQEVSDSNLMEEPFDINQINRIYFGQMKRQLSDNSMIYDIESCLVKDGDGIFDTFDYEIELG